jgi:predicted RNA-binding Zn ribbon-like protein
MHTVAHTFRPADLVGGHLVLDLANTVTARNADPVDWLDTYERALEWAGLTGHFEPSVLIELARMKADEPDRGAKALARLKELRETAHDVVAAVVRDDGVPQEALARLDALWKDAASHTRVAVRERRPDLTLDVESSGLDYLRHELALHALELVQTLPLDRTRVCDGSVCGWLFIDTSKGGRRRWCDMATCGNAAKSRRHYQRRRRPG